MQLCKSVSGLVKTIAYDLSYFKLNGCRYLKAPLGQSKQASLQTITANAEKSRLGESMDTEDKVFHRGKNIL